MVAARVVTYLASWTGWFRSTNGYDRSGARTHPSATWGWVPDALRSLWHYHAEMYEFQRQPALAPPVPDQPVVVAGPGPADVVLLRGPQERAAAAATSPAAPRRSPRSGTPSIWWGATLAIFVLLFMWALRRDWRAGAILAGLAAGYLPWFHYQDRTIYTFYAVAFVPWVVLAVTYCLGLLLGPRDASPARRLYGGWPPAASWRSP